MSKYTDFYPASSATGFPFTGSATITGSLAVTGSGDFSYQNTATAVWSAGGNMIIARRLLAGVGTQAAALAFGGLDPALTAATEEYNSGTWSNAPSNMIIANRLLGGAGTQTAALGFGGFTAADTSATEEYNSGTWSNAPSNMIIARSGLGGAGTQTAALGFGGVNPADSAATEEYGVPGGDGFLNGFNFSSVSGDTTVLALVQTSAAKHKRNIESLGAQMPKIKSLNPVRYSWKDRNAQEEIGFIAEEVNQVYPELVSKDDTGQISGINYAKMVSVLVKSVQEQQDKIESLNRELDDLTK